MKIGILTFHDALNVGAVLEAFALQEYIEGLGYNIEFINYSCRPKFTVKRIVGRTLSNTIAKIKDFANYTLYGMRGKYNKVLHVSKVEYSNKTLSEANSEYDIFIVGSDQVWNFNRKLNYAYLLSFVNEKKKKVAYAVSMGQCNIPIHLHDELKTHLRSFNYVSCREENATVFLNSLTENTLSVRQCVDPTLLISPVLYENIAVKPKRERFAVSYILNQLDAKQRREIVAFCRNKKIPLVNLRNPDTCIRLKSAENKVVPPYEWLGYIIDSEYVVCGSFHATVFSLIFHKQFVVIESEDIYASGGNQRVRSLLRPLGLEDRCICHEHISVVIEREIDWQSIDKRLDVIRKDSECFLNEVFS